MIHFGNRSVHFFNAIQYLIFNALCIAYLNKDRTYSACIHLPKLDQLWVSFENHNVSWFHCDQLGWHPSAWFCHSINKSDVKYFQTSLHSETKHGQQQLVFQNLLSKPTEVNWPLDKYHRSNFSILILFRYGRFLTTIITL